MSCELSWGLTIITYNRVEFLVECLKYALQQTRLPAEVVVVDASDDWQQNHQQIASLYADAWQTVRLVYKSADVRSIPFQRNQALALTEADVIFSLDDDIYLHPDAANIIMQGYEKDTKGEIAMIGGHYVDEHPGQQQVEEEGTPAEPIEGRRGLLSHIKTRLEEQLSLEGHFVAYGKLVRPIDPPESVQGMRLFGGGLLNGGRTTFRRSYGIQCGWSELLRYYAIHDDSDFSYRVSHFGQVLVAPDAKFFHADGAEARPDRFKINTIRVRNLMALHRSYSKNRLRSAGRLLASFGFFTAFYLLIDFAQRRYSLPSARAYALGALQVSQFMFYPFKDFSAWYINKQEQMHRSR